MPRKLSAIVAVKKGTKQRIYGSLTELHKEAQKSDLYNGFVRTFAKKDDDAEDQPGERKKVQLTAKDVLERTRTLLVEMFDVEATNDYANCHAKADVEVDGQVLIKDAPATYLLYLEKALHDLRVMILKIPTLAADEEWSYDDGQGLHRSAVATTRSTKKAQKPLVLYHATDKHPAQTQMITEDITVGHWETIKFSGAIAATRQALLVERVTKLLDAAKAARQKANEVAAEDQHIGAKLFDYIYA